MSPGRFDRFMLWVWRTCGVGWTLVVLTDLALGKWRQAFDHALLAGMSAIIAGYKRDDLRRRGLLR